MGAIGELRRPDEIAPAHFHRVELHLARRLLDQPLHQEVALGPARSPIGACRHRVGQHRAHPVVHERHVIHGGLHLRPELQRNDRRGAHRHGADIAERIDLQRENAALAIERQARPVPLIAPHVRRQEILRPVGAPSHRPAELARRVADERILGRKAGLHAEAAADVADDDPELIRLRAEHGTQQFARAGRRLVLRVERGATVLDHGDARARLERHGDHPLVVELDLGDVRGAPHRGLHGRAIAVLGLGRDVARRVRPDERRTGRNRALRVHHARQVVVFHGGKFRGILCLRARLCDDGDDRLADVVHLALGKRRPRRRRHRRAVGALEKRRERDMPHAVGAQLCHGPGGYHPRCFLYFRKVNGADARMRMRRAHQHQPALVRQLQVVAVATLAGEEALILQPLLRARGAEACRRRIELHLQGD